MEQVNCYFLMLSLYPAACPHGFSPLVALLDLPHAICPLLLSSRFYTSILSGEGLIQVRVTIA